MGLLRNDGFTDSLHSLNTVIKNTYNQARKQIQGGIDLAMEEFRDFRSQAESYMDNMTFPINNFLKDLQQIDSEFRRELDKDTLQFSPTAPSANIIPIDQAIKGCWEENY